MEELSDQEGHPVEDQIIEERGRQLDRTKTLGELGITSQTTLSLRIVMRGC